MKWWRSKRRNIIVYALIIVCCVPFAAWLAARWLIVAEIVPARADAIMIFSGAATYVERTRRAAALFHDGRADLIVLTDDGVRGGWSQSDQRNLFFVERAKRELERAGVPPSRIEVVPQRVTNTYEEALRMREYAEAKRFRTVLFVTSAYHSRRVRWTLGKAFAGSRIEFGLAIAPTGEQTPAPAVWWLSASGWRDVAGEYVKLTYYKLNY